MTHNRKIDPEVLEREYIFDSGNPPISYRDLAKKHGLAYNTVALKATKGRWYKRRIEFREKLGMKTVEQLGEQWVRFETAVRERAMAIGIEYLEKYAKALSDDSITVSTRDMLGVAAMLRAYTSDANAAKTNGEEVLLDPDSIDLNPEVARRVLARLDAGPRSDAAAPEAGVEELGPD